MRTERGTELVDVLNAAVCTYANNVRIVRRITHAVCVTKCRFRSTITLLLLLLFLLLLLKKKKHYNVLVRSKILSKLIFVSCVRYLYDGNFNTNNDANIWAVRKHTILPFKPAGAITPRPTTPANNFLVKTSPTGTCNRFFTARNQPKRAQPTLATDFFCGSG